MSDPLTNYTINEQGCFIYNGGRMGQMGYAQLPDLLHGTRLGHRACYTQNFGEIPEGMDVGHTCDTPPCINPKHLVLQTRAQNIQQAFNRGRGVSNWPVSKGVANTSTTLTDDKVREIRKLYAAGGISQDKLGKMFNLGQSTVYNIVNNITWRHVK